MPKYFRVEELFPRVLVERFAGFSDRLWVCIDPRLLWTLDAIRERWGVPLTCNDWHTGGRLQQRGFRQFDSTVGAALSQHKFGRAADLSSAKMSADKMRADILANPDDPAFRFISRIEDGRDSPTWLHLDCGIIVRGAGEPIQVVRA